MKQKLMAFLLIAVINVSQIPLFGQKQTQDNRGIGNVPMKNEQTGKLEEVKLYQKSYALIIGESKYKFNRDWKELEGVRQDVAAVEKLLREQSFDEIVVVQELTRVQLDAAIRSFIGKYGLARENRLLIYYAGHGFTETTEDGLKLGYIVPIDAPSPYKQPEQFAETAISMNDIESYALSIKAKHALFVFDSCFSGTILRKTRATPPPYITFKAAQPVRQFITSGSEDQVVPDVSEFRRQFEAGLRGEADLNNDGFVTGSELGDFLQEKVTNYSKGSQTPLVGKIANGALDKGDFIFKVNKITTQPVPKPNRTETTITELTPAVVEREAWLDIQDSTNPQVLREFIKEYPNGAYVGKAKIRLEQLVWESVKDSRDRTKLQAYLDEFPQGVNAPRARLKLTELNTGTTTTKPTTTTTPPTAKKNFTNSIGMEFVYLPSGRFKIGSPRDEKDRYDDEGPQKEITIAEGFWLGKYEVTQAEYEKVMSKNPSYFKNCPHCPVENVTWEDAKAFIAKLNERNDGYLYRLPSEAEWEYAGRAGTQTRFYWGDDLNYREVGQYAWYAGNSGEKTHEVGLKLPNQFGLYDMSGNVWEWCEDIWVNNHQDKSVGGSANLSVGDSTYRVQRGGSWDSYPRSVRSAIRNLDSGAINLVGFRVAVRVR